MSDDAPMVGANMVEYISKIFIVIVLFFAIILLIKTGIQSDIDTVEAESNIFYYRLIYSNAGISYYDPISNRVHPGVIDIASVMDTASIEQKLADHILFSDKDQGQVAAKIQIFDKNGKNITEFYLNRNRYEALIPLTTGGTGPGAAHRTEHGIYVLLADTNAYNISIVERQIREIKNAQGKSNEVYSTAELKKMNDQLAKLKQDRLYSGKINIPAKMVVTIVEQNT